MYTKVTVHAVFLLCVTQKLFLGMDWLHRSIVKALKKIVTSVFVKIFHWFYSWMLSRTDEMLKPSMTFLMKLHVGRSICSFKLAFSLYPCFFFFPAAGCFTLKIYQPKKTTVLTFRCTGQFIFPLSVWNCYLNDLYHVTVPVNFGIEYNILLSLYHSQLVMEWTQPLHFIRLNFLPIRFKTR